jgi:DNA-binding CsgD family transcriptional regulator
VLERLAAPSLASDARGTVMWLNAAAVELLGDVRGRRLTAVIAPHDQGKLRKAFAGWLAGIDSSNLDAILVTGEGGLAPCTLSSTALIRDGYVVGVLSLVTRTPPTHLPPPVQPERLSPRQFEVLQLLATGATTDQIANALHLSPDTVRNHVGAVLRKLNAKSRLQAVAIARRDILVIH